MGDAPDNLIFEYLRRLDTKLDRVIGEIGDLKIWMMTAVEEGFAQVELLPHRSSRSATGSHRAASRSRRTATLRS
jgi:hypothetical protein